jgi:hypothetical protein
MPNKIMLIFLSSISSIALCSCVQNAIPVRDDVVPLRTQFDHDAFGGYLEGYTLDGDYISGELIGERSDSIIVVAEKGLIIFPKTSIREAKVIIFDPVPYKGAWALVAPPIIMAFGVGSSYYASSIPLGLVMASINSAAVGATMGAEKSKFNYLRYTGNWEPLLVYARFPGGVPSDLSLNSLTPRSVMVQHGSQPFFDGSQSNE